MEIEQLLHNVGDSLSISCRAGPGGKGLDSFLKFEIQESSTPAAEDAVGDWGEFVSHPVGDPSALKRVEIVQKQV